MISTIEIQIRILALKKWLHKNSPYHFLFNHIRDELHTYTNLMKIAEKQGENEIYNQVKTQYYQQLDTL